MTKSKLPRAVVISGPSGAGKGSLIQAVLKAIPSLELSVSVTTRAKRPSERDGYDYYFKSDAEFDTLIQQDAFLEWCSVHTDRYGTLTQCIKDSMALGKYPLIELDTQGFQKLKSVCDTLSVFIAPPSLAVLYDRLKNRQTEDEDTIQRRLVIAKKEMACLSYYDHSIINDNLDDATERLINLLNQEI